MHLSYLTIFRIFIVSLIILIFVPLNEQNPNAHLYDEEMTSPKQNALLSTGLRDPFAGQFFPQYETAILERFESNGKAVFLLEEHKQEIVIPHELLPDHIQTNTWFDIWIDHNQQIIFSINDQKTIQKHEHAKQLQNQLRTGDSHK